MLGRYNDVARAAPPECNNRRPARLGFHHGDPEVLLGREDEGAGMLHQPHQFVLRHYSLEFDVWRIPGQRMNAGPVRAATHHDQAMLSIACEGFHDDICSFVWDEATGKKE